MIIYVDIDETICRSPEDRDYAKAVPITDYIHKVNELYDAGNTIVCWTARGIFKFSRTDFSDILSKKSKLISDVFKINPDILGN